MGKVHISFRKTSEERAVHEYIRVNIPLLVTKPIRNGDQRHNTGERMAESNATTSREELSSTETGLLLTRILETSRILRNESPTWLHSLAAISETEGDSDAA